MRLEWACLFAFPGSSLSLEHLGGISINDKGSAAALGGAVDCDNAVDVLCGTGNERHSGGGFETINEQMVPVLFGPESLIVTQSKA